MLTIKVVCVGKLKENYLRSAIDEYSKRLSKFCKLDILEIPDEKIPDKLNENIEKEIKLKESTNIIHHLKNDSYNIALDLNGKQYYIYYRWFFRIPSIFIKLVSRKSLLF